MSHNKQVMSVLFTKQKRCGGFIPVQFHIKDLVQVWTCTDHFFVIPDIEQKASLSLSSDPPHKQKDRVVLRSTGCSPSADFWT